MMRVYLNADPETDKMIDDGKDPAAWIAAEEVFGLRPNIQDYDDALKAIEKLEELAARESSMGKFMISAGRVVEGANRKVAQFLGRLLPGIESGNHDGNNGRENITEKLTDAT